MATISSCTNNLPARAVYLQRPCRRRWEAKTSGRRRRRNVVVACSAATRDEKPISSSSVVGDMERGSLAEKSGRSDGQLTARWREIHGSNNWDGLLDPIDTVLRGELIRYGEFAQACYDAFDYDCFSQY